MEYDSESSCGDHVRNLTSPEEIPQSKPIHSGDKYLEASTSPPLQSIPLTSTRSRLRLGAANKTLSAQVMEYYHKYSQSSSLDQYFSLPVSSTSPETVKYYYSIYEVNPKIGTSRQDCIGEEYNLRSYVPKERRRWARPPLIGQSSTADASNSYIQPLADPQTPSPDPKRITPDTIPEEKNESQELLQDTSERKTCSPTSSIASHKPLEWDSGADVGYFNSLPSSRQSNKKLSTIERMALARGCSAALRLDPEGTTESGVSGKITIVQTSLSSPMVPNANSTPLTENPSESESELEITPIVKNHIPGSMTGLIKSEEKQTSRETGTLTHVSCSKEQIIDKPKTSVFKVPITKRIPNAAKIQTNERENNEYLYTVPLKKSTSMNMLNIQSTQITLKRSQSELNLLAKDKQKGVLPLIFNSTSSIATVVNKPATSDKVIQTSINECSQESVGVQVSVLDEENPPLPKRGSSLQKSLHSILKNPKGTYKVSPRRSNNTRENSKIDSTERIRNVKPRHNSTEISQNGSALFASHADDTGNMTGRANSFEYLPGHIYENVPNGNSSRVSSVDTGESNSTIPNTSSSIDEKLWGDSDSLVRDLERSVNILKSLVDANKCDKQVKKRLIHHVVKRLVTAKYTDDKIEHNLEDNVPWNPDDARKKVYRTEILQALAKKHSTTDSSDDWKLQKKNGCIKMPVENKRDGTKKATLESSNSEKFDGNTDRTEMDGRKARMGLRTDDCQQISNTPSDPDKSESSECFFPQRNRKSIKTKNIFCLKDKCKLPDGESTTTNSTPPDHNRLLLDAVVNSRRTATESSNNTENNVDWRLPTTLSERQFELRKCSNSDSGDTKLVSYAEMEKRNQLIWITNEISHLSNLKKLLEQPRKLERPKSSPQKSKQPQLKEKELAAHTRVHGQSGDADYSQRHTPSMRRNSITDQWSSHCNLAACRTTGSTQSDVLPYMGKRNSCAQTATATACAHSRIGGEIVSAANTRASSVKLINVGTQTSTSFLESDFTPCTICRVHKSLVRSQSKCSSESKKNTLDSEQNVCAHCLENQSQITNDRRQRFIESSDYRHYEKHISTQLVSANSDSSTHLSQTCHPPHNSENGKVKQKDTKNQINTSKSKYSQCNNDCVYKVNGTETNAESNRQLPCPSCSRGTQELTIIESDKTCRCEEPVVETITNCESVCTCSTKKDNIAKRYACSSTHIHSHKHASRSDDKNSSMRHDLQYQHNNDRSDATYRNSNENVKAFCRCQSNCVCENKRQDENRAHKLLCNCCLDNKHRSSNDDQQSQAQSYLTNGHDLQQQRVQTNLKCNCGKDCSCANKLKAIEEQLYSTKYTSKANYTNEPASNDSPKSCRCCRTCGVSYESTKKCNCYEAYPKSVAYEISFSKSNEEKDDNSLNANANALPRISLTDPSQNSTKQNDCACEKVKSLNPGTTSRKNTLQDYLSRNKPDFVDNAETRRQFMSEISHLRELRKEKRLQLLAMASTSGVLKAPKPSKPPVYTQRKITDAEMKERLRKRYFRLNEVRSKRQQQERQEEARRNKLMAKIFCKKLQQKVLRGQVDLSQSVSVISNL